MSNYIVNGYGRPVINSVDNYLYGVASVGPKATSSLTISSTAQGKVINGTQIPLTALDASGNTYSYVDWSCTNGTMDGSTYVANVTGSSAVTGIITAAVHNHSAVSSTKSYVVYPTGVNIHTNYTIGCSFSAKSSYTTLYMYTIPVPYGASRMTAYLGWSGASYPTSANKFWVNTGGYRSSWKISLYQNKSVLNGFGVVDSTAQSFNAGYQFLDESGGNIMFTATVNNNAFKTNSSSVYVCRPIIANTGLGSSSMYCTLWLGDIVTRYE